MSLCNNEHGLPDCGEFVKLNMSKMGRRERRMCFRYLRASVHLLDEGSTVTLIDETGGESNRAKGRRETLRVSSVGGNEITDEKSRVIRVKIKGLLSRNLRTRDSSDHQKPAS
ncbi:hypothetical protein EVAR_38051_1 [Eumeta japonica]|uniref:Uncharacterized protein n=1 Tax=Eumeta variegata TaxID=151549 RepID=A0A4C1WAW2_EUMVA|nr:hypothetical protein EVAR_38051_1 [Eumeta japonica]